MVLVSLFVTESVKASICKLASTFFFFLCVCVCVCMCVHVWTGLCPFLD